MKVGDWIMQPTLQMQGRYSRHLNAAPTMLLKWKRTDDADVQEGCTRLAGYRMA